MELGIPYPEGQQPMRHVAQRVGHVVGRRAAEIGLDEHHTRVSADGGPQLTSVQRPYRRGIQHPDVQVASRHEHRVEHRSDRDDCAATATPDRDRPPGAAYMRRGIGPLRQADIDPALPGDGVP
jgi:hypothetical protein